MKGQRFRALDTDGDRLFDSEMSVELHISIETESAFNKDNADMFDYPEAVGYSFDMTVEQQVKSFATGDVLVLHASDIRGGDGYNLALVKFSAPNTHTEIASGEFWCTSTSYKSDNKKIVTATHKFEGTGELTVAK